MRKYGAFEVEKMSYNKHLNALSDEELKGSEIDAATNEVRKNGKNIGVMIDGIVRTGFPTPSR